MKPIRGVLAALAVAALATTSLVAPTATAAAKKTVWTVSTGGIGPLRVGMTEAKAKKDKLVTSDGVVKGAARNAVVAYFDQDSPHKLFAVTVTGSSPKGWTIATKSGVKVGTTVAQLRKREKVTALGNYGYGYAFTLHTSAHRWLTFFVNAGDTVKPTDKVYSIAASSFKKPAQGH